MIVTDSYSYKWSQCLAKNMKKLRLSLVNWNRDDSSHWIFDKKMTALLSQLETTEALNGQCQLEKRWQILLVN